MTVFSPSLPPARQIVTRMPASSGTGGAANALRCDRYGVAATAPAPAAVNWRNRRRENGGVSTGNFGLMSRLLRQIHLGREHHQREQVDEAPVRPRVRVGALRGEPCLQF